MDSFLAIVQTDITHSASSLSGASLPKMVPLGPLPPDSPERPSFSHWKTPPEMGLLVRSQHVSLGQFLPSNLATSVSWAPPPNTQLYQMGLVLANFRSERCFLHVVLVLISRRASCRRCSATVLCVFLLVVAIHRSPHYEGLGYDNARTPSWISLYQ